MIARTDDFNKKQEQNEKTKKDLENQQAVYTAYLK